MLMGIDEGWKDDRPGQVQARCSGAEESLQARQRADGGHLAFADEHCLDRCAAMLGVDRTACHQHLPDHSPTVTMPGAWWPAVGEIIPPP